MTTKLSTSPYVTGGPELDLLIDDHDTDELWRRHSYDLHTLHSARIAATAWTDRKSLSARDALVSKTNDEAKQQYHRYSQPSLARHSFPSPASTATSSSTSSSSSAPFRPWSSAGSTASSPADDNSGSPLTSTTVRFAGVAKKDAHCIYTLHIDTTAEQFVVNKRYSQFRAFRQQLFAMLQQGQHCGNGPCKQLAQLTQIKFPRRRLLQQWKRGADLAIARERLFLLQRFTDAMLRVYRLAPRRQLRCCVNTNCAAMEAVRSFLEISARGDTVVLAPPSTLQASEIVHVGRSSLSSEVDTRSESKSVEPSSRARQARGFPPPTRVSLAAEPDHHFDQLYTITEDSELVHLQA